MSYFTYNVENHQLFISPKETAFRTSTNGKDTTNGAGDTFYRLGLLLNRIPRMYLRRNRVTKEVAGSVDWGHIGREGFAVGTLQLSGEIKDLGQMLYFCGTTVSDGNYETDTIASGQGTSALTMTTNSTIALNALAGLKGQINGTGAEYTIASNTATNGSQIVVITLTGNSPADCNGKTFVISVHNHVFVTTTARPSTPPSFQLLHKLVNETTAESTWSLLTGCIITQFTASGTKNSPWTANLTIEFANIVAGTALTTEPDYAVLDTYHTDKTVLTLTKATVAYNVLFQGFSLAIVSGFYLHKAAGEDRAGRALKRKRDFKLNLNILSMEKIALTDFEDTDPAAATDLDISLVHTRVASTDLTTFAFEKMWCINDEYDWGESDYHLQGSHDFIIKPTTYETGAKMTLTEVNGLTSARYEA